MNGTLEALLAGAVVDGQVFALERRLRALDPAVATTSRVLAGPAGRRFP